MKRTMSNTKQHTMHNLPTQLKSAQVIKSRSPRVMHYAFLGTLIVLYFDNGTDQVVLQKEWEPLAKEWTPAMNT
jgi:hypothetical protein